jgi:protein ImuB
MTRIACIHFPNWPIQRLVVASPELRRQHVVLFSELANRGRLVTAASPLAVQLGVRIGMPLTEAKSLLRRVVFHVLPFEPHVDRAALIQLARQMHAFSPTVGVEQTEQPQTLLLDITGVAHLFRDTPGDEQQLLSESLEFLRQRGYVAQAAAADTIGQAWALAQFFHHHCAEPVHLPTQPATANRTSLLFCVAPIDSVWEMLGSLPPAALRLDAATCETLSQLGIETIAQLRQLPRASLAARFGDELSRRLDQASGVATEVLISESDAPTLYAEQLLDFPICDQATVQVVIERLLEKLCHEMRTRQQGALQWEIRLLRHSATPLSLTIGLFQPTATVEHLMQLVAMQIEQQHDFDMNAAPVEEVTVAAMRCVLLAGHQGQLFDENPQLDRQSLAHLVNRLAIRLGTESIVRPALVSGAQPEFAFRYQPLVGGPPLQRKSTLRQIDDVMARPLRLLQPAQPIAVSHSCSTPLPPESRCARVSGPRTENTPVSGPLNPQLSTLNYSPSPPALLVSSRWRLKVTRYWGPERIETGWWRGPTVRRDYWRVAVNDGQQLWIYRDLETGNWFLQGTF